MLFSLKVISSNGQMVAAAGRQPISDVQKAARLIFGGQQTKKQLSSAVLPRGTFIAITNSLMFTCRGNCNPFFRLSHRSGFYIPRENLAPFSWHRFFIARLAQSVLQNQSFLDFYSKSKNLRKSRLQRR